MPLLALAFCEGIWKHYQMEKLTGKQAKFVAEYIVCLNGTEAARRAGYAGDDRTLASVASQNFRKINISRAIDEMLQEFAMPANEVMAQLTDIGRGDIGDLLTSAGRIDLIEAKRRGKSQLVKRYKEKVTTYTDKDGEDHEIVEVEIELYDRQSALNTLAKYHNLVNNTQITIVTWEDKAVEDIKEGKITFEDLSQAFDLDLATQLFLKAGVSIEGK